MSVLRRKNVLANINKEQLLPNAKRSCLERISLRLPQYKQNSLVVWPSTYRMFKSANKPFKNLGTKDKQRLKISGTFSKYQVNRSKHSQSFRVNKGSSNQASTVEDQWKQISSDPEILNVVFGYQNPRSLCSCSVTRFSYNVFRFVSSPCR